MPNMQSGAHQQADVRVSGRLLGQAVPALVFSERHGQLRATDHHLSPAVASNRHIVRRQTALPYAVAIDQDAKLFERLQSTFVFSSCAKMRVDF